jgi:integrase/recombinase XerD
MTMTEISPLRRRMLDDMTIRNLSPATQRSYLQAVTKFSHYLGRSPDHLGLEDVRAFQVHLVSSGLLWPALKSRPLDPGIRMSRIKHPGLPSTCVSC